LWLTLFEGWWRQRVQSKSAIIAPFGLEERVFCILRINPDVFQSVVCSLGSRADEDCKLPTPFLNGQFDPDSAARSLSAAGPLRSALGVRLRRGFAPDTDPTPESENRPPRMLASMKARLRSSATNAVDFRWNRRTPYLRHFQISG